MSLSSHLAPDESPTLSSTMPPAWSRRLVAFGMDFLLVSVLLDLVILFLPKLYEKEVESEFTIFIQSLRGLDPSKQFDLAQINEFVHSFNFSQQALALLVLVMVIIVALPIAYFFVGDFFFKGKSLGKATFGLQVVTLEKGLPPNFLTSLCRSTCKGLASLILIPIGLLYFLFAFFNRDRRCLHDLLTRTVTVQTLVTTSKSTPVSEEP